MKQVTLEQSSSSLDKGREGWKELLTAIQRSLLEGFTLSGNR